MSEQPKVKVPSGMMLVEDGEGNWEIVKSGEIYDRTLSFKTTAEVYAGLIPLIESFPQRTVTAALRWLIENDEVREIMRKRVTLMTKRKREGQA